MHIVDTWGWDKLKVEAEAEEEHGAYDIDEMVRAAVYEFETECGLYPNRIIMGYKLLDKLRSVFLGDIVPIGRLEELAKEQKCGIKCQYDGIPVKVDYENPNNLEVGYMVNYVEDKYLNIFTGNIETTRKNCVEIDL